MTNSDLPDRGGVSDRGAARFYESTGVDDWRVLWGGRYACACFRGGSFGAGARLVQVIGELAATANHYPGVDLRPEGVTVRLFTPKVQGLTGRDVDLARKISAAARQLQLPADPSAAQHVQIAIDALDIPRVRPFWQAVLGYDEGADDDLLDAHRRGPVFWFQQMDAERPQRNRIHLDIYVPRDQVDTRIAAALEAGGSIVSDQNAPRWWTLADPEGNEADVGSGG